MAKKLYSNLNKDITIITVAAHEGRSGLAEFMIQTVSKFTDPLPHIIVCNNGDNQRFVSKYNDKKWITIVSNNPPGEEDGGFKQHGHGLNKIVSMVKTPLTAIIETDCVILNNGWYDIDWGKYDLLAAEKGKSTDNNLCHHLAFLVGKTEILKNIDFTPSDNKEEGYIQFTVEKSCNTPSTPLRPFTQGAQFVTTITNYDNVGWRIGKVIQANKTKFLNVMPFCGGKTSITLTKDLVYNDDSFELWLDNKPIVAHFWKGSAQYRPSIEHNTRIRCLQGWKGIISSKLLGKEYV